MLVGYRFSFRYFFEKLSRWKALDAERLVASMQSAYMFCLFTVISARNTSANATPIVRGAEPVADVGKRISAQIIDKLNHVPPRCHSSSSGNSLGANEGVYESIGGTSEVSFTKLLNILFFR